VSPAEIQFLTDRIRELGDAIAGLRTQIRESHEELSKEVLINREDMRKALYGGNGDKVGIYEKLRVLWDWKRDHSGAHAEQNVERRRKGEDLRAVSYSFAKDVAKLVVSALIAYALFTATGGKVTGIQ
jgi:hypothetical protein